MLTLFVPGLPIAQARPRFRAFNAGAYTAVQVYDQKNSAAWKDHVQVCVKREIAVSGGLTEAEKRGPISLALRFMLPRPKHLKKSVTEHTKKPDLDNLVKAVKDALGGTRAKRKRNKVTGKPYVVRLAQPGLCYVNDSQVVEMLASKKYAGPTTKPGVYITVKPMRREKSAGVRPFEFQERATVENVPIPMGGS